MTTFILTPSTRRSQGRSRTRPPIGVRAALLAPVRWVLLAIWLIATAAAALGYCVGAVAVAGAGAIGGRQRTRAPHAHVHRP